MLAPVVYPRFKQLKFLNSETVVLVKSEVENQMETVNPGPHSTGTNAAVEPPEKRQRGDKDFALDILFGPEVRPTSSPNVEGEMELYIAERPAPGSAWPLAWWKMNESRFPHLAHVTCGILRTPATSTPSERTFSTAGLTVTKLRSCFLPGKWMH